MKIEINKIPGMKEGAFCFVHARGAMDDKGNFIITTQPLNLSGCDVFYGMHQIKSSDGGKTWSQITPCKNLVRRPYRDGMEFAISDATPMYHKKTGKFLKTGHCVFYLGDKLAPEPIPARALYSVYDETQGDWSDFKELEIADNPKGEYYRMGSGCCQCVELENGDILVPVTHASEKAASDPWHACSSVSVLLCSFDGKELKVKEKGSSMTTERPRGFGEPSVVEYNGVYYMCIRNDETGYVSKSSDGLHYETAAELVFDDGRNAGNYNTQQHWIKGGGKLYLVYTRRADTNNHVFRHRAPLFIAEFDTEKMCLVRETEQIAVPERGARLGNFGCFNLNDNEAYVVASEWMQSNDGGMWKECAKYGSDNSIFVTRLTFDKDN